MNAARFAPSIMTSSVQMGFSPFAVVELSDSFRGE